MQRYHVADVSPDWFLCLHAWGGGGSRDVMTSDKWHGEGLTFRKLILNWNSVSHGAQTFTEGWSLTSCPSALTSLSQRTKRLALRPRVAVCAPELILLSSWKTAENVHLGEISLFIKYDTEIIVSDFNLSIWATLSFKAASVSTLVLTLYLYHEFSVFQFDIFIIWYNSCKGYDKTLSRLTE